VIVADASLLAYLVLPGEHTAAAEAVYARDPDWLVPTLCLSELRSVMSKYVAKDLLTLAEANSAMERASALIEGREVDVDARAVLALTRKSQCTSYDCEYVSVALDLGVPLVTSDRQVMRAFPKTAISPSQFAVG
jgi:predicted nucleic acid-binding protein